MRLAGPVASSTVASRPKPTVDDIGVYSRIWQSADFGRATKLGLTGPLPDGAAGWLMRVFDTEHGPAERWGARNLLLRLEQLEAAAKTLDARGGAELDDFSGPVAHLVLPAQLFGVHIDTSGEARARVSDGIDAAVAGSVLVEAYRDHARSAVHASGNAILYIRPDIDTRKVARWERDVFAKLRIDLSTDRTSTLATLDPHRHRRIRRDARQLGHPRRLPRLTTPTRRRRDPTRRTAVVAA